MQHERRPWQIIGLSIATLLLVLLASIQLVSAQPPAPAKVFDVTDYGAKADGVTDDQIAIGKAILAAQTWTNAQPLNRATVFFPAGTYALTRHFGLFAINIVGARNLTLQGKNCLDSAGEYCVKLIGAPAELDPRSKQPVYNSFFRITNSKNITISNFYLDKERPYFTQGIVTGVNPGAQTMNLRMDPGFADFSDPLINALFNIIVVFTDPKHRTRDHSDAACSAVPPPIPGDTSCPNFHILSKRPIGNGAWQIRLDRTPPQEFFGERFLIWGNLVWQTGMLVDHSSNVTLQNIFYTGGGGPAAHLQFDSGNNTIRNVTVDTPPGSSRLFAATSGFNGTSNRGEITLDHVRVTHTDDDAFHFSAAPYFPALQESSNGRTLRVALCYNGDFQTGDKVVVWNWRQKKPIGSAIVLSSHLVLDPERIKYPRTCDITLNRPLPALANMRSYSTAKLGEQTDGNDRVLDLSLAPFLTVENSYLSSMRARCGIIQVSALIVNNTCRNVVLAGFIVGPEFAWGEGYAVNGVKIIGNEFYNVSGTAIYLGDIVDSATSPTYRQIISPIMPASNTQRDNQNILIEDNSFTNLGTFGRGIMGIRGVAITIQNAQHVQIFNNHIAPPRPGQRDAPADILISPTTTSDISTRP